jgi:anti-sigma-K factor RskA
VTSHDRYVELVAPYLLGALDPAEREELEAHLEECKRCRHELDLLRVGVEALPVSVPQHDPPPELRERVMSVVRREAELLAAAGPEADRPAAGAPSGDRPRWWRPRLAAPLAAAAAVAMLALVMLAGDDARTIDAGQAPSGSQVRMLVHDEHATLVAEDLPAPPRGRVYQVWLKRPHRDPEPTRALFRPGDAGTASVDLPVSVDGLEAVLVTHEPLGGSAAPTRDPVIAIEPS